MSDLVNQLHCRYPMGPIMEDGEPEFGWRDMSGTYTVGLPLPIMIEAADRIAELDAALAEAQKDAARYALLRRGQQWSIINGIGDALRADDLDAAIDAAMQEGKR